MFSRDERRSVVAECAAVRLVRRERAQARQQRLVWPEVDVAEQEVRGAHRGDREVPEHVHLSPTTVSIEGIPLNFESG